MDVVIFYVDIEVVLLQQAVHTQLQLADVFLHLVVIHSFHKEKIKQNIEMKKETKCCNVSKIEKKNTFHTWVARVQLIEAINSAEHEVEDHLAVWTVHARS